MGNISIYILGAMVLVSWLISEFGPEDISAGASIAGIAMAVVLLKRYVDSLKENKKE